MITFVGFRPKMTQLAALFVPRVCAIEREERKVCLFVLNSYDLMTYITLVVLALLKMHRGVHTVGEVHDPLLEILRTI